MKSFTFHDFLDYTDELPSRAIRPLKQRIAIALAERKADKANADAREREALIEATRKVTAPKQGYRARLLKRALERYDNIVGRFDAPQRLPSRILPAPAFEEECVVLRQLGAVENADKTWTVPEHLDENLFADFWPLVPEDLRDTTPRMLNTKQGRAVSGYLMPSDQAKGDDSTATPLMYGGITTVALLVFLATQFSLLLAIPASLLFVPFVVALAHGESKWEAVKTLGLVGLLPLGLSLAAPYTAGLTGLGVLVVMAWVFAFFFVVFDSNNSEGIIGGAFERFRRFASVAAVLTGAVLFAAVLPVWLRPAVYFALASIYPVFYANANYVKRGKWLNEFSHRDTLARAGGLSSAHVQPRLEQAKRALKDTSPLYVIGTATGWLTKKHFPYAPDKGMQMVLSAMDLTTHFLCFGETGIGKTASFARPIAKQWMDSRYGGLLVLDGKGALAGDLSSILDIKVGPGVRFAPFQGLDGNGLATALNSVARRSANDKDGIWGAGADIFIRNACVLFEALHEHEKAYKAFCAHSASLLELDITRQIVVIEQKRRDGGDVSTEEQQLAALQVRHDQLATYRDAPREWLWNGATLARLFNMIYTDKKDENGAWTAGDEMKAALEFLGFNPSRADRDPNSIHADIGKQGLLDEAIIYVTVNWPSKEPNQKSSFYTNVDIRILPLLTAPYLLDSDGNHWKNLEEGVDVSECLRWKAVGVDLPEEKHQEAGRLIAALVSHRVYNKVALRGSDSTWREQGESPLMLMMDECQDLVSDAERRLLPKARSLGMCAVMLTQGFESLVNAFEGEMKATQFCNTFQSLVCMRTSPQTYDYIAKRLGTAPMVKFSQPTIGLDYWGSLNALAASPLNDVHHPQRELMKELERKGAGQLVVATPNTTTLRATKGASWNGQRIMDIDDASVSKNIVVPQGGKIENQPIFLPEEYTSLLTKGQAFVVLNRAGERRIDLAKLDYLEADALRK